MGLDDQLWSAMYRLYCLLAEGVNEESSYQRLFEQNPVIFSVLGVSSAASFEKSSPNSIPFDNDRGFKPEPDFIGVELPAGNLIVVELKTPFVGEITTARQDGNRAKFKALAESYVSQASEYVESIRQRSEARDIVRRVLDFGKVADYRVKIVYALGSENDASLVSSLASQRKIPTEVVFYDDLFYRMVSAYSVARRDTTSRPGWCFVFHMCFEKLQPSKKAFIAEYGGDGLDRISVYVEEGDVFSSVLTRREDVIGCSRKSLGWDLIT